MSEVKLIQSKVRDTAKLLKKSKEEDAGFDVWLDIPKDFKYKQHSVHSEYENAYNEDGNLLIFLHPNEVQTLPTGIRLAIDKDYWTDFKHERGSTGSIGLSILSGVVDSGYRGEVFLNIVNLSNDVIAITDKVSKVTWEKVNSTSDVLLFPYEKAIAQMVVQRNYKVENIEMNEREFMNIPSERGTNALGSTDVKQ